MIDKETAIKLAKEAGMQGMLTYVICTLDEVHHLCTLAIAHAQKDAEPMYQVWQSTDSCEEFYSWDDVDKEEFDKTKPDKRRILYTHPDHDDTALLRQALEALESLFGIPAQHTGVGGGGVAVWRLGGSAAPTAAITALRERLGEVK